MSQTIPFGRVLKLTAGQPLTVGLAVPISWQGQPVTLSLCDGDQTPLASTLSKRAAIDPHVGVYATYAARDVAIHLVRRDAVVIVARCGTETVAQPATILH